jgi:regulatory protein
MIITKIELQKKNKHRFNLYIDDVFKCGIHEDVIIQLNLKTGMDIDTLFFEELLQSEQQSKAKSDAIQFISYRMRSTLEVEKKLKNLGYEDIMVNKTIEFLKEHNLLNDLDFAEAYISDKTNITRHSLRRIKYDLMNKGLSEESFDRVSINYIHKDEENLLHLLPIKYAALKKRYEDQSYVLEQKLFSFFYQKGFAIDTIKKVYRTILSDD